MGNMKLIQGDCLEVMEDIADKSIDMILADLPYGLGKCNWDSIIDMDKLWEQYHRIIKDNGAIVLFAQQPFSSLMINARFNLYKYSYIWIKNKINGFLNAKLSPTKKYEEILVFSKAKCSNGAKVLMKYNPQGLIRVDKHIVNTKRIGSTTYSGMTKNKKSYTQEFTNYPTNILYYNCESKNIHHMNHFP